MVNSYRTKSDNYLSMVAMVTGQSLGLQVSMGLCPDRNGKTVISRKMFIIWYICTTKCTVGP